MATLSAMFKLYDRYSTTITTIMQKTDRATQSILGASKQTDGFNDSLKRTDAAATKAGGGLGKLIGAIGGLAAAKKAMDMTDTYMSTNARLSMITDSLEQQKQLQQDIFAAANRSRGNYVDMANAAAKLKMLAGNSFGSNQEAVGFTELLTKSLKISGASQAEQNSAFLQLTQAMTSGRLQGDEFRSVMENAPMVADAIANYMGKSKGELKELSSQGVITSDIIKNAMFAAADDINGKFAKMPMTFGDIWNRIKNAGMDAFGGVFEKLNNELNSASGQMAINNIISGIYTAANYIGILIDGAMWFYNIISNNWGMIEPVVMTVVGAFIVYNVVLGITNGLLAAHALAEGVHRVALASASGATFLATVQQYGFNTALMACPVTWIVAGLAAIVAGLYAASSWIAKTTGAAQTGFGIITGCINVGIQWFLNFAAVTANVALAIISAFAAVGENMQIAFHNSISAVTGWLYGLLADAANVVSGIAAELNKLPFVTFDYSGIQSKADEYAAKAAQASGNKKSYVDIEDRFNSALNTIPAFKDGWASDAFKAGSSWGDGVANKISGIFPKGFSGEGTASGFDMSQFATAGSPATVKGTGKGGAVKVESEEDVEWMRKLAERDYVARISQNTLAPNIRVEFTGPITKEADVDGVAAHMAEQLKEIIATAPEGVYP